QPNAIHEFGGWSHDGSQFAFSANREKPDRFDVYVQKIGGTARLLRRGPGGFYGPLEWSPDDRTLLINRLESSVRNDLYVIDVESGKQHHLTPHEGDAQYHSAHFAADGKSVYCASTAGGRDLTGLARIDMATGKLTYLESPPCEIEGVQASPKGRWL